MVFVASSGSPVATTSARESGRQGGGQVAVDDAAPFTSFSFLYLSPTDCSRVHSMVRLRVLSKISPLNDVFLKVKTEVDETDMDIDSGSGPIRRSKRQAEKAKNREDTDVKMKLEVKEEETKSSVTTEGSEKLVKKDESEEVEVDAKPETAKVAKSKSKKGQKKRKRQSTENSETMQDPPVTVATDTEKSNSTRGPFRQCDMEVFAAFPKNVLCNVRDCSLFYSN